MKVNGLTWEVLKNGAIMKEVLKNFSKFCDPKKVILSSYVSFADKNFLLHAYKKHKVQWKFDYHVFDLWGFFYAKLDVTSINVPVYGDLSIGWLVVPLFVLVVISTANAVNITDGLDGLAGGLVAIAFGNYAIIAFLQERFGVAGFCMTVVGALLSYTWFNIYPARFFMGDVGSFALGTALGVVAMITDTVLLLPIIGAVFVAEAGSSLIQILSKKLRNGKKIFKIAPLHHHFEASGWPETKVTMRFWVLGQVCGVVGLMIFLLGSYHV
jgi:phospho-N-acetylmuramoyl-pentapeptide-transferase